VSVANSQSSLRDAFPFFHSTDCVYLDSAATSQKPLSVIQIVDAFWRHQNANVHRASYPLANQATHAYEQARKTVQQFIGASRTEEIIFTKGATESINMVAYGLAQSCLQAEDEILVSVLEHHANLVPWQQAAIKTCASLKVIPTDAKGVLDLEQGLNMINPSTKVLALSHVSNALGNINPIIKLITKAKSFNALVLIDGAQAAAHLPINVQQLDCDFYVFSGHKVYAPTGIGVLYGRYVQLEQLPVWQTGGEMVERVSFQHSDFLPPPLKFEAGTPNTSGAMGLKAAIEFVTQHQQSIHEQESNLYHYLITQLQTIEGVTLWGDIENSISTQSFTVNHINSADIGTLLAEQQIAVRCGHHCAMPLMQHLNIEGTVRVSLACYNTRQDIDALIAGLKSALVSLSSQSSEYQPDKLTDTETDYPLGHKVQHASGWQNKYREIMLAGKHLNLLPESQRNQAQAVAGCESQVWLQCQQNNDRLIIQAYSNSKIVRGLLSLVLEALAPLSIKAILDFDLHRYLQQLGLAHHLSESRGNGLNHIMYKIKNLALHYMEQ
jgi:cysteine desulfurase/selenocysteine lyase